jgi:hypothetical protein
MLKHPLKQAYMQTALFSISASFFSQPTFNTTQETLSTYIGALQQAASFSSINGFLNQHVKKKRVYNTA